MSYITLLLPDQVPQFPQLLEKDLETFLDEHRKLWSSYHVPSGVQTRSQHQLISDDVIKHWRDPCFQICSQSPLKLNAILNWLAQAIYVDVSFLDQIPHVDCLNIFLSVFILHSYGDTEQAIEDLASWQRYVALKFTERQKNYISDLTNQVDEELYDADLDPSLPNLGADTVHWHPSQYQDKCNSWARILHTHLLNKLALVDEIDEHAHNSQVKYCTQCLDKSPDKKCIRSISVTLNHDPAFLSMWNGVGISKVPPKDRMQPNPGRKTSLNECHIVHPDELGLQGYSADEEVIRCCGKQLLLFFDGQKLCHFAWYNAFTESVHQQLVQYSERSTGVQPVNRGGKFAYWSSGQMVPFGARQPSGGRRADYYSFYAGIEAESYEGIMTLFEQAEISATMLRTAQAAHPALVAEIREKSKECERVGISGQSMFSCNGYTAPQHMDVDCTPSLCAQFTLNAESKWSEYAFCFTQYGFYIETRSNMLCQFF
ncbi:hypothetical protein FB446DRAFT_788477 [Lentinula raphanica]|nr:hypothetical protein FB446DRAFT_788477 [Lentinula raphanica]